MSQDFKVSTEQQNINAPRPRSSKAAMNSVSFNNKCSVRRNFSTIKSLLFEEQSQAMAEMRQGIEQF